MQCYVEGSEHPELFCRYKRGHVPFIFHVWRDAVVAWCSSEMMELIQAIHFLLVTIFLFTLPTKGLVDSCDHCVQTINKFCCERDKSIYPEKKYCCEFGGATEKPPTGERHRDGYSTRCSMTEAPWGNVWKRIYHTWKIFLCQLMPTAVQPKTLFSRMLL